ncbi:MAG: alpha-L-arabinofuranosidase C-terminal domain-containing protein [Amphiplicatus sp.]
MKYIVSAAGAAAALALAAPAFAQSVVRVSVSIDQSAPGPVIEPTVYGHFAEHLGRSIYEGVWVGEDSDIPNTKGFRNDVLEALKALEVPVIRWPGGCFADEYHWRDGIGPREERPVRINTHWGWVQEDNSFGTHEFLDFVEMIGAEAYVAGNMGSGTPRDMAQWVEYMTSDRDTTLTRERKANGREEPWDVKYFGVGNESWGCGGHMDAEYSSDLHSRYATFVKVDPGKDIVKVASGGYDENFAFTETLTRDARPATTGAISLHYYTLPTGNWEKKGSATGFPVEEWSSTLWRAMRMDEILKKHKAIMDKHDPEKRIALYVDEWGNWYDAEPGSTPGFLYQQNSLRDAITTALTLNIFHRHTDRVKMANIAQMVNVLQASILTDGPRMTLTPTYHTFALYKPFKGAAPYPVKFKAPTFRIGEYSLPHVDVSAARGADGKLLLALVNLHPDEPAEIKTDISGSASGQILTADRIDAHNTFDAPETVKPAPYEGEMRDGKLVFRLPAKSVAVVSVE